MPVNWYWKHKVGEIIYFSVQNKQRWKLELFGGNMMCAFIYRFRKVNEETGKKENWHTFFVFLNDMQHAKRVLKDDKDFLKNLAFGEHKLRKIRLCISSKEYKYSNKEMLNFAKLLTKYGYKVEVY